MLTPERERCASCGQLLWIADHEHRRVVRLDGVWRLTPRVRRCRNRDCAAYHRPCVPEEAGAWALPQAEFGLDVIALVGHLRYREQRSVPQIPQTLRERGVQIAERSVPVLLHRYEELVALRLGDATRLRERLAEQRGIILALDGVQPDVGHEVLWVLRDVRSGEVLLARSLLSATAGDLAPLLVEVRDALAGQRPEDAIPILGSSPTGSTLSATRSPVRCPACRTNSASFIPCARRRDPSARPTATPRRNSRSGCGACGRLNGTWTGAATPRRRPSAATAWRSAGRSPTTAGLKRKGRVEAVAGWLPRGSAWSGQPRPASAVATAGKEFILGCHPAVAGDGWVCRVGS